jgi:tetrapyrrole methylase family protein/MazG family protein
LGESERLEDVVEKRVASRRGGFDGLLSLVARLRSGCPWDRAQTPDGVKVYLIEEAYEVLEALESGHVKDLCSELGDLLFQIAFMVRLFEETGDFTMEEVIEGVTEKMIRRHPHVFGSDHVSSPEEVRELWHRVKAAERGSQERPPGSWVDSVPRKLPALMRTYRLQERASKMGMGWPSVQAVLLDLEEELAQLRAALERGDDKKSSESYASLLFAIVGISRFIGIHPETALTERVSAFVRAVHHLEASFKGVRRATGSFSPDEMGPIWDRLKKEMAKSK